MPKYRMHGLCVCSSIELPELSSAALPDVSHADVTVVLGRVPETIPYLGETEEGFLVGTRMVLVEIDEGVRYLVEGGDRITIQNGDDAPDELVRLSLYGAAFSVLLQQRGLMALHASAVVVDGRAIAFAGPTMHGKSTLASALGAHGLAILGDDKLVIQASHNGGFVATPGPPALSLFEDAAMSSGQSPESQTSDLKKFGKFTYLVPGQFAAMPVPVAAICFIRWAGSNEFDVRRLGPFDALIELRKNLNMPSLVSLLGQEGRFLEWAEQLLEVVSVYAVSRPNNMIRMREDALRIIEQVCGCDR